MGHILPSSVWEAVPEVLLGTPAEEVHGSLLIGL